jgi:hypothetical protein
LICVRPSAQHHPSATCTSHSPFTKTSLSSVKHCGLVSNLNCLLDHRENEQIPVLTSSSLIRHRPALTSHDGVEITRLRRRPSDRPVAPRREMRAPNLPLIQDNTRSAGTLPLCYASEWGLVLAVGWSEGDLLSQKRCSQGLTGQTMKYDRGVEVSPTTAEVVSPCRLNESISRPTETCEDAQSLFWQKPAPLEDDVDELCLLVATLRPSVDKLPYHGHPSCSHCQRQTGRCTACHRT